MLLFWLVRKTAKSDYLLRHVSPSFCLFVRRKLKLGFQWIYFHEIWCLGIFRKSVQKIQVSLKSDTNKGYFTWRPKYILIVSRWILLRIRNVSDKVVARIKTHILRSITFLSKIFRLHSYYPQCEHLASFLRLSVPHTPNILIAKQIR